MIARPALARRALVGFVLWVATVQLTALGGANGAEPPPPGPLDRPIADLALIEPGADAPPLLLTLDTVDQPVGRVRIALLRRDSGWAPIDIETLQLSQPSDAAETPWLIELAPGSFVIISTSHEEQRTTVQALRVVPGPAPELVLSESAQLDIAVDDAGAIDVDADALKELVVASALTLRAGGTCQGSVLRVLDGRSLQQRLEWTVPNVRLAGGSLGEFDADPGGDILAYVYGNCPAGPDNFQRLGISAIRLRDATPIVSLSPQDPAASSSSPGVPLIADLDGDGRDEVVARDGGSLVILEPGRDWARTEIAKGDVMALLAVPPDGGRAGTVVWLDHTVVEDNLVFSMARIVRAADGGFAIDRQQLDLAAVSPARRARVLGSIRQVAIEQLAPQAWRGDIDRDGCEEILAPLLTAPCATAAEGQPSPPATMRVGATWYATRPVVAFEAGDSRELLIAATMDWDPSIGGPLPATPSAVGQPGAWRHGPSSRFALSEVRAADAAYFSLFPVPRPTIETVALRSQGTDFPGFTGARIFVRASSARHDAPPELGAPALDAFLSAPGYSGELIAVKRIPVPAGAESGRDGSFAHLSLADVRAADGGPAERWEVTIAQVNEWGEIAGPVRGTIIRDTTGPSLTLETPFLSAPWPLEATMHGRSEPNVAIQGGDGGPVTADRRGRFQLQTHLAPWPQTVELTAVDESGNTTTRQFIVVGGVDYRAFPWATILAVTLLLGAVLSAGRSSKAVRQVRVASDNEPLAEIEELPFPGDRPRA